MPESKTPSSRAAGSKDPEGAQRVQLTGRAVRFVQLLVELGHADPETANQILVGIGQFARGPIADLDDVRRAAAVLLFPTDELGYDSLLAEDWALLFS